MNEKTSFLICDKYEIRELKTEVEILEMHVDGLKEMVERLERRLEEEKE